MIKTLLPIFYLPPISWFSEFVKSDQEVILEQFENFPKQTYRNRANIFGANGKLSLIIPIAHTGSRMMKDIQISYAENWQKLHWKSIKTAYQSSPYFEFYEDRLEHLFLTEDRFLVDFNLKAIETLQQILKTDVGFGLTTLFEKEFSGNDLRNQFSAKSESTYEMDFYYQTFSDKLGFIKDLSVLDLICNLGPESKSYLSNL